MRHVAFALSLILGPALVAQTSSTYRITHTYTLGGDGSWDYIVPDPPNHRLFIGRQNRVMVVDEDDGNAARRSHRHPGRARHGDRAGDRARIRHVGQRSVGRHVRSEDLQGARPDSRGRGRRRDHLRRARRTASSRSTATRTRRP